MSGLMLKIAPGERFIVNGAVLENGDRHARIRIADNNVRVLRCSDAIHPEHVDTPVKQVYFAVQLIITGDVDEDEVMPALLAECRKLDDAFSTVDRNLIPVLTAMLSGGRFYSALCHLKQVIALEEKLLSRPFSTPAERRVA